MNPSRGFSLIEVLISLFIFSILIILFQSVMQSSTLVIIEKNRVVALSIVQDEIEKVRANGYEALPVNGTFQNSLLDNLPSATASITSSAYDAQTARITARVLWQDTNSISSSTIFISTLLTKTGGLP